MKRAVQVQISSQTVINTRTSEPTERPDLGSPMAERQHDLKIHIKNYVVKAAMGLRLTHHYKNQEIRNINIVCNKSRSLKYC